MDAACAVEMVHTSSLILDDLPSMDGATLRRGKAANHVVYGEDTSILAAMFLLNAAFGVLAEYRQSFLSPSLSAQLVATLSRSSPVDNPKALVATVADHRAIADAIAQRAPEAARRAMRGVIDDGIVRATVATVPG